MMHAVERQQVWPGGPDLQGQPTPALRATLMLADGTEFVGNALGMSGVVTGEAVFTTAMTGYQEALTDPSYQGQILLFTYPLIGNYGISASRSQSARIHPRAVLCSHFSPTWDGQESLADWLQQQGVPLVYDLDTRALTLHLRRHGAMPAALALTSQDCPADREALHRALRDVNYDHTDFVAEVTPSLPRSYGQGKRTVALLDCGSKQYMVRELIACDAQVAVLPAHTFAHEILELAPDGVLISNGPGNPEAAGSVVSTIRELWGRVPLFGICLGHQLLALAAGAETHKLPFGHRGTNHPVAEVGTGRAYITTQNHGYAVRAETVPDDLVISHRHLHDGTVEGLRHRTLPIRSLQFHPEGAPGPRDGAGALSEWMQQL